MALVRLDQPHRLCRLQCVAEILLSVVHSARDGVVELLASRRGKQCAAISQMLLEDRLQLKSLSPNHSSINFSISPIACVDHAVDLRISEFLDLLLAELPEHLTPEDKVTA